MRNVNYLALRSLFLIKNGKKEATRQGENERENEVGSLQSENTVILTAATFRGQLKSIFLERKFWFPTDYFWTLRKDM